jgi:hypothetical protein
MATTPTPLPVPVQAAMHGPYEDMVIAAFVLIGKLVDGQTPEQKAKIWQDWITFWAPFVSLMAKL